MQTTGAGQQPSQQAEQQTDHRRRGPRPLVPKCQPLQNRQRYGDIGLGNCELRFVRRTAAQAASWVA
jgi:hypothetical protein